MVFGHHIRGGSLSPAQQWLAFLTGVGIGAVILGAGLALIWYFD